MQRTSTVNFRVIKEGRTMPILRCLARLACNFGVQLSMNQGEWRKTLDKNNWNIDISLNYYYNNYIKSLNDNTNEDSTWMFAWEQINKHVLKLIKKKKKKNIE